MITNDINLTSPIRTIRGRVAFRVGATLTYASYKDNLIEIKVDRTSEEGKFFGFGISQKATITIRDKDRAINPKDINTVSIEFADDREEYITVLKDLEVIEAKRDENNNNITLVCYDCLYKANLITVNDLYVSDYEIDTLMIAIANRLCDGMTVFGSDVSLLPMFREYIPNGANIDGTETLREILDDFAEFYPSIYFINKENKIEYRLTRISEDFSDLFVNIDKSDYFTLSVGNRYTLSTMIYATELGDNVSYSEGIPGETFVIKDNCFLNNNPKSDELLAMFGEGICDGGSRLTDITCSWRGNCFVEPGDYISITTKDNSEVIFNLYNDSYTYNGGLKGEIKQRAVLMETPEAAPITLGGAIKDTYARVDKVNKRIDLVVRDVNEDLEELSSTIEITAGNIEMMVSKKAAEADEKIEVLSSIVEINAGNIEMVSKKVDSNEEAISAINVNTESINMSVSNLQKQTTESLSGLNDDINVLSSKVDMAITAEDVNIAITKAAEDGASKVETTTGYRFDDEGLTISKTGSEMSTIITEYGMAVVRDDTDIVLYATNQGVLAENLQANNFLIIDGKTRFEYIEPRNRIGCFWIGG